MTARHSTRTGCYPGSFDPLTVAHLAIAEAALVQCNLARVDLVMSRSALGKDRHHAPIERRASVLEAAASTRPWLGTVVTDAQLLADIASGYDVLILGADKWAQVVDVQYYGSSEARDAAVARLPEVACAPRAGYVVPAGVIALEVDDWLREVSSTSVRAGRLAWRAPEASDAVGD